MNFHFFLDFFPTDHGFPVFQFRKKMISTRISLLQWFCYSWIKSQSFPSKLPNPSLFPKSTVMQWELKNGDIMESLQNYVPTGNA
ncbi:MAG: hypothetical protein LPK25_12500, partial [Cyclobacteriaceae bacterium]|nr:hypothetical protein [Cyclobacteriaceae bacterium]MDX5467350.1 hypothetical protein [Cyclobacteriaceae bacterium]